MKKLNTTTGGHPFKLDNLLHMQEGVTESLTALSKAIGQHFKLWGVDVTLTNSNNTATWTAGAIVYDNEVCLVDAGTVTKTSLQVFRFGTVDSYLAIDPQTYADASTNNVHLVRKATIVAASIVGTAPLYSIQSLAELLNGAPVDYDFVTGHFTANSGNAWTVAGSGDVVINGAYDFKKAFLNFEVSASTVTGTDSTIISFAIPTSFLPVSTKKAHGFCLINGVASRFQIDAASSTLQISKADGSYITGSVAVSGQIWYFID